MSEPVRDIARIGHAELLTTHPERSLEFFTGVINMEVEARQGQSAYLRGYGDYLRYSLKLTETPRPVLRWGWFLSAGLRWSGGTYRSAS